jgi:hypothetical protein
VRAEVYPLGLEIVSVGLEMGGAEMLRPFVESAQPEHPSLVDTTHRMDALFGITNIPQSVWIDEAGNIVRPPERGSPGPVASRMSDPFYARMMEILHREHDDMQWYSDRIRDWVAKGSESEFALEPSEVIERSHPRSADVSAAAAHFELAQHIWQANGFNDAVFSHFASAHTLQPENITYKRQAYSAWSYSKDADDPMVLFKQVPVEGEEDEWPFVSNFLADIAALQPSL